MTTRPKSPERRLIIDLYHGASDARTVRALVEFAQLLSLDLHCLFIEDEAVLALADLPFARELRLPTHEWRPIAAETIAAEFHQAASQAQRLLDQINQSVGVPSVFEVIRGDPVACIMAACRSGDIVVVAEPGTPAAHMTRRIAQLYPALYGSGASILLLPARLKPWRGSVVAVLADAADASLEVAAMIAATSREMLVILLPDMVTLTAGDVLDRVRTLGAPPERMIMRRVASARTEDVLDALAGLGERLVVMARAGSEAGEAAGAARISTARGVPVLLIEQSTGTD